LYFCVFGFPTAGFRREVEFSGFSFQTNRILKQEVEKSIRGLPAPQRTVPPALGRGGGHINSPRLVFLRARFPPPNPVALQRYMLRHVGRRLHTTMVEPPCSLDICRSSSLALANSARNGLVPSPPDFMTILFEAPRQWALKGDGDGFPQQDSLPSEHTTAVVKMGGIGPRGCAIWAATQHDKATATVACHHPRKPFASSVFCRPQEKEVTPSVSHSQTPAHRHHSKTRRCGRRRGAMSCPVDLWILYLPPVACCTRTTLAGSVRTPR